MRRFDFEPDEPGWKREEWVLPTLSRAREIRVEYAEQRSRGDCDEQLARWNEEDIQRLEGIAAKMSAGDEEWTFRWNRPGWCGRYVVRDGEIVEHWEMHNGA